MTVAVAAADSAPAWSATLNVKLAVPFQFAAGVNFNVPRSPRAITRFAVTALSPTASAPAVLTGRVTTRTAFRLSPVSRSSLNTPSNCAAVNVSTTSSVVLTASALAAGGSFAALTVLAAVAVADCAPA